jgi:hypothetical protein
MLTKRANKKLLILSRLNYCGYAKLAKRLTAAV